MKTQITSERIGNKVKYLRALCGLTIEKCAELTGISARQFSSIEHGKVVPTLQTVCGLCFCFDVSIEFLISQELDYHCFQNEEKNHE